MRRIKNNKGATLLISLLFFVVCAVIGSIILGFGIVASNKVGLLTSQQQSYYTATSASKMMKSILEDTKCEFIQEKDDKGNVISYKASASYQDGKSILPEEFFKQVELSFKNKQSKAVSSIPFAIENQNNNLSISDQSVFNISTSEDTAYFITIDIQKNIDGNSYQCQVYAPAVVTTTEEMVWYDKNAHPVIDPGANLEDCTSRKKITTTITWPDVAIKRPGGTTNVN